MVDRRKPLFVRPLDLGSAIVCGSADTGHPVGNLGRHKDIGLTWKATDAAAIWARGQFSAEQAVGFCSLVACNAQVGTQVRLRLGSSQAEVDGAAPYDSGAQDFLAVTPRVAPADGLYHSHLEFTPMDALWWRIDVTGHVGEFEAAMLVLGNPLSPSRFYDLDYERGVEDLGQLEINRFGVVDEAPGAIWRTLDFALGWQSEDEWEASFRPLVEALGTRNPVLVCFDPASSQDRQSRTYMGFLKKPGFARGTRKPRTYLQEFSILSFI